MAEAVIAGLVGQGYKAADAKRYVLAAGEASDEEALLRAAYAVVLAEMDALKRKGADGQAAPIQGH